MVDSAAARMATAEHAEAVSGASSARLMMSTADQSFTPTWPVDNRIGDRPDQDVGYRCADSTTTRTASTTQRMSKQRLSRLRGAAPVAPTSFAVSAQHPDPCGPMSDGAVASSVILCGGRCSLAMNAHARHIEPSARGSGMHADRHDDYIVSSRSANRGAGAFLDQLMNAISSPSDLEHPARHQPSRAINRIAVRLNRHAASTCASSIDGRSRRTADDSCRRAASAASQLLGRRRVAGARHRE